MISILFLAADPTNASRLRLGEEVREIEEKLRLSRNRDEFNLVQRHSVRPQDISQALLDINPQIVHFSGHGTGAGALCVESPTGELKPIRADALAALFENFSDYLNCIIMNACYSATQATAIARHIPYVIGMSQAVGDRAAIAFSVGFYQALGAGRSIENAFKLGVAQIRIQGIPEHLTPVLITRSGESSRPVPAAETPSKATSPSPVPSRLVKESQKQLQTSAANLWSNFAELAAKYGIDPSQLTPGARFSEDLELDSLDLIELIMEVEDFYGIEIPDNEVANIMTLGQAAAYLQRKLGR